MARRRRFSSAVSLTSSSLSSSLSPPLRPFLRPKSSSSSASSSMSSPSASSSLSAAAAAPFATFCLLPANDLRPLTGASCGRFLEAVSPDAFFGGISTDCPIDLLALLAPEPSLESSPTMSEKTRYASLRFCCDFCRVSATIFRARFPRVGNGRVAFAKVTYGQSHSGKPTDNSEKLAAGGAAIFFPLV